MKANTSQYDWNILYVVSFGASSQPVSTSISWSSFALIGNICQAQVHLVKSA
jgi:hypothetical protein